MKKTLLFLLMIITNLSVAFSQGGIVVPDDTLCTPNPSKEAVALYRYLLDLKGKKILSGQQDSPWGIDEFAYLKTNTGKQPAIKGMDFITQSDNANEVQKAINWWKAGGIPTIMWHWGAPGIGEGYENSKKAIAIDNCFIVGTKEYTAFWAELKVKADLLVKLRDANVPVIWRPYHELNGNWFWWGKQGSARFKKLWTTMFDYFVKERGLNNLIWTLCYTGEPDGTWYPGDAYVDIAGADTYGSGDAPQMTMFNKVKTIINDKYPIAYHECGIPPNPDQCLAQGGMWSWWMEWHTDYLVGVDKTYLKYVYSHDLVVTLDEVPNIMSAYGWDGKNCKTSVLNPQIKIDGGDWLKTNKISIGFPKTVICKVETIDPGTVSWSGYGTSGSGSEQTITINGIGTVTAVFKNECGATSTQTFNIVDDCTSTAIKPYIQVSDGGWNNVSNISVNEGSTINFGPQPVSGGSWIWTGGGTSGTSRQQTIIADASSIITAKYTNDCGKTTSLDFNITVIKNTTGLSSISKNTDMSFFPVPCKESLTVDLNSEITNSSGVVCVYTMQGTLVSKATKALKSLTINTSGLKPDMYILTIVSEGKCISKKFIKIE